MANSFMYTMMRQRLTTPSWYKLEMFPVNPKFAAQVTLMPSAKQDGSANYGLADQITKAWSAENLYINPKDTSKCNFEGYYDKIISHPEQTAAYIRRHQTL